tara:strand:- start:518 stop:823 length:306 start_codon:yes stop_codon:yes gene_type:complete
MTKNKENKTNSPRFVWRYKGEYNSSEEMSVQLQEEEILYRFSSVVGYTIKPDRFYPWHDTRCRNSEDKAQICCEKYLARNLKAEGQRLIRQADILSNKQEP